MFGHGVADSCKVTRVALDVLQWADHSMATVWLLVHTFQLCLCNSTVV